LRDRGGVKVVLGWLTATSRLSPHIVSQQELQAVANPVPGNQSSSRTNSGAAMSELAVTTPVLLALAAKAAVMAVLDVLADLFIRDEEVKWNFLQDAGVDD
jgi:hypothetical protein